MRDDNKRRDVFWWLWQKTQNIFFLQETHSTKDTETMWKNEWGGQIIFSHGTSNARGVAIMIKNNISMKINKIEIDTHGRYIFLDCEIDSLQILLVNLYAPNDDNPEYFEKIFRKIANEYETPNLVFGGDFNFVQDVNLDKKGGQPRTHFKAKEMVTNYMEYLELIDVWRMSHPTDRKYTWKQPKPLIFCRLDYFLVSQNLVGYINKADIVSGYSTDHSLITLSINPSQENRGPGYWKLNCSLLSDLEYVHLVKKIIHTTTEFYKLKVIDDLLLWETIKLNIRGETIKYSSWKKKERTKRMKDLESEITRLEQSEFANAEETLKFLEDKKSELDKLIHFKTKGAMIRSRARYYEEGEKNSKYFFDLEKRNSGKKDIHKLIKNDNSVITNLQMIMEEENSFYKNLYESEQNFSTCDDTIKNNFFGTNIPKLSEESKEKCEGILTEKEILTVLKTTKNNKSPGIDGLPADFYKVFWVDISKLLTNALNCAYHKGLLSISHRRGIISLIPKKGKNCWFLKNWRPISLLCCDYKLAAKTIAYRLKDVLSDIVNSDQSGFMKNRFIGENINTIFEIIEKTEEEDIPGMIFSIDFEKAFDKIDWDFMEEVLQKFNFGESLRKWIKLFYTNTEACVSNYGWLSQFFSVSRGLRQGCPLSPYLFIICAEILSIYIRENNDIRGININDIEYKLCQYADDTSLFLDGSADSLDNAIVVLDEFAKLSGLKINFEKSIAYKIGGLRNEHIIYHPVKDILWSDQPISTLGVIIPIHYRENVFNLNYGPAIKSIENKLKIWSQRDLTLMGKAAIIKSLILGKLIYLFSNLPDPPGEIFHDIEAIMFKFLWNRKPDKIKRKVMYNDTNKGGLGIPHFQTFCKSMKISWVKRLFDQNEGLWKILAKVNIKEFGELFVFQCNLEKNDLKVKNIKSKFWKDVLSAWCDLNYKKYINKNELQKQIIWNNSNIQLENKSIYYRDYVQNGLIYVHSLFENGRLKSIHSLRENYGIDINFLTLSSIIKAIPKEWRLYFTSIQNENDTGEEPDNWMEKLNHRNSNKIIYQSLIHSIVEIPEKTLRKWKHSLNLEGDINWEDIFNRVYQCTIESKLRNFQYKFIHRIIYTNERLCPWGLVESSLCDFCNSNIDTLIHRFWMCEYSQTLWQKMWEWACLLLPLPNITPPLALLNVDVSNQIPLIIHHCIILTKFYIYRCYISKAKPSWQTLSKYIYRTEETERCISIRKDILVKHIEKWHILF